MSRKPCKAITEANKLLRERSDSSGNWCRSWCESRLLLTKLLFSRWLVMHKKWEFGLISNTLLTSHRRNKQHKLPAGVWVAVHCFSLLQTTNQAQLPLPFLWLRSRPSSTHPLSTAAILSPPPAPLPGLHQGNTAWQQARQSKPCTHVLLP